MTEATPDAIGPDGTMRLRGNRRVPIVVQPYTRPAEARRREGPRPETRAGLSD